MFKKIKYQLFFVLVLVMQGCTTSGNDSLRLEDETSIHHKISTNITTKNEVKAQFGAPFSVSYTDNGSEIWKYESSKVSADFVNYVPVVRCLAGSSSGIHKELTLLFADEKVKKFALTESEIKIRTGWFNQ